MKVKAAVASPDGSPFHIADVELDAPRADEVLVRMAAVGLCHTDIFAQQDGYRFGRPGVFGHEGAGVVQAVGREVTTVRPGDRVALSFRSCGACAKCAAGHPAHCGEIRQLNFAGARPDGSSTLRLDGAALASNFFGQSSFATHALTYVRNVIPIGPDVPFAVAAPLGCSVQTGVGGVLNILKPERGSALLVTGCGPVGLSAVIGGVIAGCAPIVVVEPHASRRALALDLGATHAIDPTTTPDLAAAVREILPHGVDRAFDTTGQEAVLGAALRAMASGGVLGFAGIAPRGTRLPADLNIIMGRGLRVCGIYLGDADPAHFLPMLLEHHRAGRLPIDRMIRTYPFERINDAIADQHAGRTAKAVLTFS
ncbi:MAG: NAD(P)-dependent alcohol dehydrogenase [Rhodospirillaceae bacterium]|nr:MAG: NAD(P)-dependent alcohol dehydrogenase [Rhodospirillaceae bacterium]